MFADNASGDISAIDARDGWVYASPSVGLCTDTGGTVDSATPDINTALAPTYQGGQGLQLDGAYHWEPVYNSVTVPAGFTMVVKIECQFTYESTTNTACDFYYALNGVEIPGSRITIDWSSQTVPLPVHIMGVTGWDISASPDITLLQARGGGSSVIANFSQYAKASPSLLAPSTAGAYFTGVNYG